MKATLVLLAALVSITLCGCPGVHVHKNPGFFNHGVRYYRPKPYLFVSPSGLKETRNLADDGKTVKSIIAEPSDQFVSLQLQYLPDFSEEYSITVCPGIGTADVGVTLDQGWNLTSINQKLDSKVPENIKAVADLVSAVGSIGPTGGGGTNRNDAQPVIQVAARNVPLGYYESVIGVDNCGRKQLYGWRYVGFMPFNSCPTNATGMQSVNCSTTEIYALGFHKGVMIFKPLHEMEMISTDEASAPPMAVATAAPAAQAAPNPALVIALQNSIAQQLSCDPKIDTLVTIDGEKSVVVKLNKLDESDKDTIKKIKDIVTKTFAPAASPPLTIVNFKGNALGDDGKVIMVSPPSEAVPAPGAASQFDGLQQQPLFSLDGIPQGN